MMIKKKSKPIIILSFNLYNIFFKYTFSNRGIKVVERNIVIQQTRRNLSLPSQGKYIAHHRNRRPEVQTAGRG